MNQDVRKITEGAMMVGLIGVFMLIDRQLQGTLSSMLVFVLPLPMIYYASKYSMRDSLMVFVAIVLISFLFSNPFSAFFFIAEAVIGLVYGHGIYKQEENQKILLRTMVLGALVEILAVVINVAIFGVKLDELVQEMRVMFDTMMKVGSVAIPANVDINMMIRNVFFVSTMFLGILEAGVTHMLSRILLKRLHVKMPPSQPLYLYYPPKWIGYVAVVGVVGYLYVNGGRLTVEPWTSIVTALGSFSILYLVCMGVIGLLVLIPVFIKANRGLITLLIFVLAFTMPMVIALYGFLYITSNIHDRIVKEGYHATKNE